jgi:hypothetical protein
LVAEFKGGAGKGGCRRDLLFSPDPDVFAWRPLRCLLPRVRLFLSRLAKISPLPRRDLPYGNSLMQILASVSYGPVRSTGAQSGMPVGGMHNAPDR